MEIQFKKKTDKAQKFMVKIDIENFFKSQKITKLVKLSENEKWIYFAPVLSQMEQSLVVALVTKRYSHLIDEVKEYEEA